MDGDGGVGNVNSVTGINSGPSPVVNKGTLLTKHRQEYNDCLTQMDHLKKLGYASDHTLMVSLQADIEKLGNKVSDLAQIKSASSINQELAALEKKKTRTQEEYQKNGATYKTMITGLEKQLEEQKELAMKLDQQYVDSLT
eukprot:2383008-Karenia_brevis.AAC.1